MFEEVGLPVCHSVLSGYNGAIFAYGQTASGEATGPRLLALIPIPRIPQTRACAGKTYTIHGENDEHHAGLVPRVLDHLMTQSRRGEEETTVRLSFVATLWNRSDVPIAYLHFDRCLCVGS